MIVHYMETLDAALNERDLLQRKGQDIQDVERRIAECKLDLSDRKDKRYFRTKKLEEVRGVTSWR